MATLYITINGMDVSTKEVSQTLGITQELTHDADSCSFTVRDPGFTIREGMEVQVYVGDTSDMRFAGIINSAPARPIATMNVMEYQVNCGDYSRVFEYKRVAETYQNKTCKYIIEDLITNYVATAWGITTVNVATGPTIEEISFNYLTPADCIRKICNETGYSWYVDYNKDVHFFASETMSAPYAIDEASSFLWKNLEIEPDMSQVRNKVTVIGGSFLSSPITESFVGDNTTDTYTLSYKSHNTTITEDGVAKTVGVENITDPATVDYLVSYWEKKVIRTAGNLGLGVTLAVTYSYDVKVITQAEDIAAQAAVLALEGGDGIHEERIVDDSITSVTEAQQIALAEIRENAYPVIRGRFETFQDGFSVGQLLTVALATDTTYNGTYQIQRVAARCISGELFYYTIQFSVRRVKVEDLLVKLLKKSDVSTSEGQEGIDKIEFVNEEVECADTVSTILTDITATPFKWGADANQFTWNLWQWQ